MNGYFKPLERKIGVLTLVLACLFAAGWVRSGTLVDELNLPYRSHRIGFRSGHGLFSGKYENLLNGDEYPTLWVGWHTSPVRKPLFFDSSKRQYEHVLDRLGFRCGAISGTIERYCYLQAPYWPFVITLTPLSAWLLFSKQEQPKPQNATPSP